MAEIDDNEYALLQRYRAVLDGLNGDPKAKKHLESALKVVNPSIRTEADMAEEYAAPYRDQIQALDSKFDTFLTAQAEERRVAEERRADEVFNAQLNRIKGAGYTPEGIERIVNLAKERGIGDLEAAALLFDKQNPPPPVINDAFSPPSWNYEQNAVEDSKALFEDEDRWADQTAANVLNEMRRSGH